MLTGMESFLGVCSDAQTPLITIQCSKRPPQYSACDSYLGNMLASSSQGYIIHAEGNYIGWRCYTMYFQPLGYFHTSGFPDAEPALNPHLKSTHKVAKI